MRLQVWSYHYEPEPMGIGPVSATMARGLLGRGHQVEVVAAHPHYPTPIWGRSRLPYREPREGVPLVRLPLWVGRETAAQRIRQELSYTAWLATAAPLLGRPDAIVAASPPLPALLPAILVARLKRVPLIVWLHDILPDGAIATGLVERGPVVQAARWLEQSAYRNARRIVVLSRAFMDNLLAKGVDAGKLRLIYDPSTLEPKSVRRPVSGAPPRVICMGNIGLSQGLAPLVRTFVASPEIRAAGTRLVITGGGVAEAQVRREADPDLVEMPGVVDRQRLDHELQQASLAVVTQRHEGAEFNLPSKLMNYMAYGLPVVAAVNPSSEVARLILDARAGWVVDSSKADDFPVAIAEALGDPEVLERRGSAAREFAQRNFSPSAFTAAFESMLLEAIGPN